MKRIIMLMVVMLLSNASYSQNVTYEAVKLAELLLDQTWEQSEETVQKILPAIKLQIRQAGATEKASNLLADQVAKAMNKYQFIKIYAQVISQNLTQNETIELEKFMRSDVGRKYLQLSKDVLLPVHIEPLIDSARRETCTKLDEVDRASLLCK